MDLSKTLIIPVIFKGGNYLLWARTTKTALCGRGLWKHIEKNESTKEITTTQEGKEIVACDSEKWFKENQSVLAFIQNSLDALILESYSYCETAKDLWDTLKNVFGNVSNLIRVFEVKRAINNLNQEEIEFTKHFGKFRSLWAELEMLRPNSVDPVVLNKRREQDKVFGLLLTLNSSYNDLIKHILRSDKLPSLDDVCNQIQKEHGSIGLFGVKGDLITANKGEVADKCWNLHPHLRPRSVNPKANQACRYGEGQAQVTTQTIDGNGVALVDSSDLVRRSDLDARIKALKESSGNTYLTLNAMKPLIVDSGDSHHMISDSKLISDIKPTLGNVIIANGDKIPIKGIGNLNLFDRTSKAFYMPSFTSNLLLVKKDIETSKVLGRGSTKDDLYVLEDSNLTTALSSCFKSIIDETNGSIWHARLGHPYFRALQLNYVTNQFNAKRKILRSDNGGEYTSHMFKQHLAKHGIVHQTSCPYTPQQNGVAKRNNKHLMEVARSMMFHSNVPKKFWGDAVVTACYLINRTPTKILGDISPFVVLNKIKPSINHLRVFGFVCYVLKPSEQRDKLDAKSVKSMFIGYSTTQKGYKCYELEARRVLVSRDVKFLESKGFYDEKNWEDLKNLSCSQSDRANNL
ncbi:PREDICTED: uncharacterized protein LOC104709648 [Camelina sativa]|uniref:Uncharacterized protein LOC104709648 n=1 Tax=Camelina sativa TaxID=90675 RepID=A0ABM0TD34_CAMSA|nr:PREDICTED: uncharacterized protein LOC104709648 [Camelina sativa]